MSQDGQSPDTALSPLISQLKSAATTRRRNEVPHEVVLATAIVLLEVANADDRTTPHERAMIHEGLKYLFSSSAEAANAVMDQAKNTLRSMRGSSSFADMLKQHLDDASKQIVADIIDDLICSRGEPTDMEIYLRNRFRMLIGLGITPGSKG